MLKDCVTETNVTDRAVERLHQLGEVHQRPAEPVDLVDDHNVDPARFDVLKEPLQGRALQRPTGIAAIVVMVTDGYPALGLLAGDIGFAGLALGMQAVEVLLQSFFARFAGVDGAADLALGGHDAVFLLFRAAFGSRPKNVVPTTAFR